jgi:hypothetical protein
VEFVISVHDAVMIAFALHEDHPVSMSRRINDESS